MTSFEKKSSPGYGPYKGHEEMSQSKNVPCYLHRPENIRKGGNLAGKFFT